MSDSKIFYEQDKNRALTLFANIVRIKEEKLENSRMRILLPTLLQRHDTMLM